MPEFACGLASVGPCAAHSTNACLHRSRSTATDVNNDPDLQPERSNTSELSWVQRIPTGRLRAPVFHERTRDALFSQTNVTTTPNITNIQNVDSIRTTGLELAAEVYGVGLDDLDIISSAAPARAGLRAAQRYLASAAATNGGSVAAPLWMSAL